MLTLGSDVEEGDREKNPPLKRRCPVCGGRLNHKGDCLKPGCQVYKVKGGTGRKRRGPERIGWCSNPRLKPLSNEELRNLMEPYLTPGVEKLLEQV